MLKNLFNHNCFVYFSGLNFISLSFEYFISKRILKSETKGKKVSQAIVRISVISIALAIVVNLITIAVVKGFQNQIREKVTGFNSHFSIMNVSSSNMHESTPFIKNQALFDQISKIDGVKSISSIAYKPVLFQSDRNQRTVKLNDSKDTTIVEQNVHGGLLKGVENAYDWSFFKENLKEGKIPVFDKNDISYQILISQNIASKLNYKVGDTIRTYFVRSMPTLKKLIISGIYSTGLEEHDSKIALCDLRLVQELNDWGIQASVTVDDTVYHTPGFQDQLIIRVNARGGAGQFRYDWGNGPEIFSAKTFNADQDTVIKVVVSDFTTSILNTQSLSIEDTTIIKIKVNGIKNSVNDFKFEDGTTLRKDFHSIDGTNYSIQCSNKVIEVEETPGKGSHQQYIAGYEIGINDWARMDELRVKLKEQVEFKPTEKGEVLKLVSIEDAESDIFLWLDFLDLNVVIILTLMVVIGIINMGSALLVLIIVRTNFIGILKALGAKDWSIRKIFLYQTSGLILKGMLYGNAIGLAIAFLQWQFKIIKLNPEVYYLSTVPIELTFMNWLLLNLGTLIICIAALIIPSVVITRINPSKAVKFN